MDTLIIAGHNIESYVPRHFSDSQKERIGQLCQDIVTRVEAGLPTAFSYKNAPRVVVPASVFLQNATPRVSSKITDRAKGYPHKMIVQHGGSRRAIGLDALQEDSFSEDNGWKTFHLDQIDDMRLMTFDEIRRLFPYTEEDEAYFREGQSGVDGFIRNWNYWFRIFLAQAESRYDLRVPEAYYKK